MTGVGVTRADDASGGVSDDVSDVASGLSNGSEDRGYDFGGFFVERGGVNDGQVDVWGEGVGF